MIQIHSAACAAMHLGPWAVEPVWMAQAMSAVRSGIWSAKARDESREPEPLTVLENGVAIVRLLGPMMKGRSKFGGTSTIDARKQLRAAVADKAVEGIMLAIDSPGGTTAGTEELGDSISAAARIKPVHAFIEDSGASAAYWAATQANTISMNPAGMAGSIGTYTVLYDTSEATAKAGVNVEQFTTGPFKGMGEDGVKITPEQRQYLQGVIEALNERFLLAVSRGRKMEMAKVKALADGRVHVGQAAADIGLVDHIESFDAALNRLENTITDAGKTTRRDSAERRLRLGS